MEAGEPSTYFKILDRLQNTNHRQFVFTNPQTPDKASTDISVTQIPTKLPQ